MKRKYILAAALISLPTIVVLGWSIMYGPLRNPQKALDDFMYSDDRAESQSMDSLILTGGRIVPLITKEIKSKNMPRRRYAISFLGNGSYAEALPALEEILNDPTEVQYIRHDAAVAISMIKNPSQGERRTYLKALLGDHD